MAKAKKGKIKLPKKFAGGKGVHATIPRNVKLWQAILDHNLGGELVKDDIDGTTRVPLNASELATAIRRERKNYSFGELSWRGPGEGYRYYITQNNRYRFEGPDPADVVRIHNEGAPKTASEKVSTREIDTKVFSEQLITRSEREASRAGSHDKPTLSDLKITSGTMRRARNVATDPDVVKWMRELGTAHGRTALMAAEAELRKAVARAEAGGVSAATKKKRLERSSASQQAGVFAAQFGGAAANEPPHTTARRAATSFSQPSAKKKRPSLGLKLDAEVSVAGWQVSPADVYTDFEQGGKLRFMDAKKTKHQWRATRARNRAERDAGQLEAPEVIIIRNSKGVRPTGAEVDKGSIDLYEARPGSWLKTTPRISDWKGTAAELLTHYDRVKAKDKRPAAAKAAPKKQRPGRKARETAADRAGAPICPADLYKALDVPVEAQEDAQERMGGGPDADRGYAAADRAAVGIEFSKVLKLYLKARKHGDALAKKKPGTAAWQKTYDAFRSAEDRYKGEIESWLGDWGYDEDEPEQHAWTFSDAKKLIENCVIETAGGKARARAEKAAQLEAMRVGRRKSAPKGLPATPPRKDLTGAQIKAAASKVAAEFPGIRLEPGGTFRESDSRFSYRPDKSDYLDFDTRSLEFSTTGGGKFRTYRMGQPVESGPETNIYTEAALREFLRRRLKRAETMFRLSGDDIWKAAKAAVLPGKGIHVFMDSPPAGREQPTFHYQVGEGPKDYTLVIMSLSSGAFRAQQAGPVAAGETEWNITGVTNRGQLDTWLAMVLRKSDKFLHKSKDKRPTPVDWTRMVHLDWKVPEGVYFIESNLEGDEWRTTWSPKGGKRKQLGKIVGDQLSADRLAADHYSELSGLPRKRVIHSMSIGAIKNELKSYKASQTKLENLTLNEIRKGGPFRQEGTDWTNNRVLITDDKGGHWAAGYDTPQQRSAIGDAIVMSQQARWTPGPVKLHKIKTTGPFRVFTGYEKAAEVYDSHNGLRWLIGGKVFGGRVVIERGGRVKPFTVGVMREGSGIVLNVWGPTGRTYATIQEAVAVANALVRREGWKAPSMKDIDPRLVKIWRKKHRDFKGGALADGTATLMPGITMYGHSTVIPLRGLDKTETEYLVAADTKGSKVTALLAKNATEAKKHARGQEAASGLAPRPVIGVYAIPMIGTTSQPAVKPSGGLRRYLVVFGPKSETKAAPRRAAITSTGLRPTVKVKLKPMHTTIMGADGSEIIVTKIADGVIHYVPRHDFNNKGERRVEQWIGEDLIATALAKYKEARGVPYKSVKVERVAGKYEYCVPRKKGTKVLLEPSVNKNQTWRDYVTQLPGGRNYRGLIRTLAVVTEKKRLSTTAYAEFVENLLTDRPWLAGKGGGEMVDGVRAAAVIEVTAPGRNTLYVNPEGHNYARYVLFPADATSSWKPKKKGADYEPPVVSRSDIEIDGQKLRVSEVGPGSLLATEITSVAKIQGTGPYKLESIGEENVYFRNKAGRSFFAKYDLDSDRDAIVAAIKGSPKKKPAKKKPAKKKPAKRKPTKKYTQLGALLIKHRTEQGITRDSLAKTMGISSSTLGQIERGIVRCPPKARLGRAAARLGVAARTLETANDCDYGKRKPKKKAAAKKKPAAKAPAKKRSGKKKPPKRAPKKKAAKKKPLSDAEQRKKINALLRGT